MRKKFIIWLSKLLRVPIFIDEPNTYSINIIENHYEPIILRETVRIGILEESRSMDNIPIQHKKEAAIFQIKKKLFDALEIDIKERVNELNPYSIELTGELIICKYKNK